MPSQLRPESCYTGFFHGTNGSKSSRLRRRPLSPRAARRAQVGKVVTAESGDLEIAVEGGAAVPVSAQVTLERDRYV